MGGKNKSYVLQKLVSSCTFALKSQTVQQIYDKSLNLSLLLLFNDVWSQ